nr:hypothetical protein [uncultured Cohaesibacter sp.]
MSKQKLNLRTAQQRIKKRSSATLSSVGKETVGWKGKAKRALKFGGVIYFSLGLVVGLAVDVLSFPKLISDFKSHAAEAREYLVALAFRPQIWTGIFDTFPDGFVDMIDMKISSDVEAALQIAVVDDNLIDGRVWWANSCQYGSIYRGLLIEGRINLGGSSADVQIYDFINGHRTEFMHGHLENDGILIKFSDFPSSSQLNGSSIAKNPEPARIEQWSKLYCDWFSSYTGEKLGLR